MKKILITVFAVILNTTSMMGQQWITSGSDIYNANTGKVGIGISTPEYPFQLTNKFGIRSDGVVYWGQNVTAATPVNRGYLSWDQGYIMIGSTGNLALLPSGNVGIGTSNPLARLDINGNLFSSGAIAIGTKDQNKIGSNMLAVNGSAVFTKVKVAVYPDKWPDYVFKKNYKLVPLEEIESYIQTHQHLRGIPSATEVGEKGIDLGANQAILLEKIEELTLFAIEQNKKIVELQKIIQKEQEVRTSETLVVQKIEEMRTNIIRQEERIGILEKNHHSKK